MTGIKINFNGRSTSVLPGETVSGFEATVQNAIVCMGTIEGSDKAYPEKGTKLLTQALQGKLVSLQAARHASNYAAIDTLFFVNEVEPEGTSDERITKIQLDPVKMEDNHLSLAAQFTGSLGTVIGILKNI